MSLGTMSVSPGSSRTSSYVSPSAANFSGTSRGGGIHAPMVRGARRRAGPMRGRWRRRCSVLEVEAAPTGPACRRGGAGAGTPTRAVARRVRASGRPCDRCRDGAPGNRRGARPCALLSDAGQLPVDRRDAGHASLDRRGPGGVPDRPSGATDGPGAMRGSVCVAARRRPPPTVPCTRAARVTGRGVRWLGPWYPTCRRAPDRTVTSGTRRGLGRTRSMRCHASRAGTSMPS